MSTQQFNQEEAKIQQEGKPQDIITAKPFQAFASLKKKKLHVLSQRKIDRQIALGSRGFEEEKRASKTDDDLVLSKKKTKVLHLSERTAIDLTKQKVSLIKQPTDSQKMTGVENGAEKGVRTLKKRKFGEVIADANQVQNDNSSAKKKLSQAPIAKQNSLNSAQQHVAEEVVHKEAEEAKRKELKAEINMLMTQCSIVDRQLAHQ